MTTRFPRFLLLPAFLMLLPASVSPQSLGEAAAKEREKRAKAAGQGKTAPALSNDDLASEKEKKRKKEEAEARGEKPEPDAPPADGSASSSDNQGRMAADGRPRLSNPDRAKEKAREATPVPEGVEPDDAAAMAAEAIWRGRLDAARKTVREMEGRQTSIQARIEELRARISPMAQQQEQDVNKIMAIQQEITDAEAELEAARGNLKNAREELARLEETARQAGVAPGVIRPPQ